MKKIIFIHPPLTMEARFGESKKFTGHIHPPQGLCHLASVLDKKYDCYILDAQALFWGMQEIVKEIINIKPDYIGIITFTVAMSNIDLLCKMIKDILPEVKIILGGPHITACPEETFEKYPQFSLAVLGEGEDSIKELLACLDAHGDIKKVPGILYRDTDEKICRTSPRTQLVNLAQLPRPRWDLLPHLSTYYRPSAMTYIKLPAVAISTSRGCPGKCAFCDRSVFGHVWRCHPTEQVLEWVDYLVDTYGIQDINFQDDHFMVNNNRLKTLCSELQKRHPKMVWSAIARIDSVTEKNIEIMAAAGCWQLAFGFESGSQAILNILHKNITIEKALKATKICKAAGIKVKGLFMAGCPGETEETLKATNSYIQELDLDFLSMSAFTPTPNTEIYQEWEKWGHWEGATPHDWEKMNLWEPIFIAHDVTKDMIKKYIHRAAIKKGIKK